MESKDCKDSPFWIPPGYDITTINQSAYMQICSSTNVGVGVMRETQRSTVFFLFLTKMYL